jgi:hypothetical protein
MRVIGGNLDNSAEGERGGRLPAPARPEDLAGHYDLTIGHPAGDGDALAGLDAWLADCASGHDLSCALLHDGIIHEATRRLEQGRLTVGFHLDCHARWHVADDPFACLAVAVQDAGGRPVNPPARARAFTDKAAAHAELVHRGLGVPPTVVVRPWCIDRPLTARERQALRLDEPGARVTVKPASGFARRGAVCSERTDAEGLAAALAAARQFDRQDTYLIQREVSTPQLACEDGRTRPAYWRVVNCLGEWTLFWWPPQERVGPGRAGYRPVTPAEMRRHRLQPVLDYAWALAELSGLEWFSTELCLSDGPDPGRFSVPGTDGRERAILAINYFNDRCDVYEQGRGPGGPPDYVVRRAAERLTAAAWRRRQEALRPAAVLPWRGAA